MKLGTWLLALLEPMLAKILVSLGFSVVTSTGMDAVISGLKSSLVASFNTLPPDWLNVFQLAGGGTALGIVFGAMTTKLLLWSIQNTTRLLGTNPT
jgi:hypothetical protein